MGHSSIHVSLTYLRGLEVAELKKGRYGLWFRVFVHLLQKWYKNKQEYYTTNRRNN
jgi:hypothetical protein